MASIVEFGDYIFIEEEYKTVIQADLFKTLPAKYECYKKLYRIEGRASRQSGLLIGANQDPKLTIILVKKEKKNVLLAGVSAADCSVLATLR